MLGRGLFGRPKEQFIPQERKVQTLSEVGTSFPRVRNTVEFVTSLLEVSEATLESVYNSVNVENANTAFSVLEFGLFIRYRSTERLLALIRLLSTKFGYRRRPNGYVEQLLMQQGVLGVDKNSGKIEESFDEIYSILSHGQTHHCKSFH